MLPWQPQVDSKSIGKSTKLGPKSVPNPPSWVQNWCPEPSWRGLGAILAHLGPQEPTQSRKSGFQGRSWPPCWHQKSKRIDKKSIPTSTQKCIVFSMGFCFDFFSTWLRFGLVLVVESWFVYCGGGSCKSLKICVGFENKVRTYWIGTGGPPSGASSCAGSVFAGSEAGISCFGSLFLLFGGHMGAWKIAEILI